MTKDVEEVRRRFISVAGHTTQSLGMGRSVGQIFAHVYFSREPQSLDDITEALGVSKGGASMCVRQLAQWGAVRQVWVKGDRKDYYEACDDFGRIVRRALLDAIGSRMERTDNLLAEAENLLGNAANGGKGKDPDMVFVRKRIRNLRKFRDRAQWIWEHSVLRLLRK
ncbi:MAG: hypothetical protein KJ626_04050 [Verrucomicrobia bacterium]|nr:hypothetical protein [Verrucomicrobiota bacterium]